MNMLLKKLSVIGVIAGVSTSSCYAGTAVGFKNDDLEIKSFVHLAPKVWNADGSESVGHDVAEALEVAKASKFQDDMRQAAEDEKNSYRTLAKNLAWKAGSKAVGLVGDGAIELTKKAASYGLAYVGQETIIAGVSVAATAAGFGWVGAGLKTAHTLAKMTGLEGAVAVGLMPVTRPVVDYAPAIAKGMFSIAKNWWSGPVASAA